METVSPNRCHDEDDVSHLLVLLTGQSLLTDPGQHLQLLHTNTLREEGKKREAKTQHLSIHM